MEHQRHTLTLTEPLTYTPSHSDIVSRKKPSQKECPHCQQMFEACSASRHIAACSQRHENIDSSPVNLAGTVLYDEALPHTLIGVEVA